MLLRKKDMLLIFPLVAAAFLLLVLFTFRTAGDCVAVVEVNGAVVGQYDLSAQTDTQILDLGGSYHVQLKLAPGEISFFHSDCPDQVCVRTGVLTKPGQTAVCLPARVSVEIQGEAEVDGVTG